ncbi:MAG: hexokinase [Prevotellaceae bacterium]|jgi:hexokinase|nr:hexokinase [Prevotellaceae bacterium]
MKNNIFALTTEELKKIAGSFKERIEEGLIKDNQEILCIPTHITPKSEIPNGKVLALDWGGTNFRAAVVEFKDGKSKILERAECKLSAKEKDTQGTQADLYGAMANTIGTLQLLDESVTSIGYCFSYPAAARLNGDAILLRWTKGIDVKDMLGEEKQPNNPKNITGETFVQYLNNHKNIKPTFTNIKVINDTVACLFGGLSASDFDSYIGLIVGTGTNMASLMRLNQIKKLNSEVDWIVPINLESGNFNPPYLTVIDGLVDAVSNNKGSQRFEKAISGGYLGEIFKTVFMNEKIEYDFNGEHLSAILENPNNYSAEWANAAQAITARSAKLVASSIDGLVQVLVKQDAGIKNIALAADGSLFWKTPGYKDLVEKELKILLPENVTITILPVMEDPNLTGAAIAALS